MLREILIPVALAVAGWAQSILLSLQTWESVRYARRQLGDIANRGAGQGKIEAADTADDYVETGLYSNRGLEKVAVLVPCKGNEDDLGNNLQPVLTQTYPNYEVLFLIESPEDEAQIPVERLIAANRNSKTATAVRIVHTGRAIESGQKVHNLLSAIDQLSHDISILAFVDSDACPNSCWLEQIVAALDRPKTGAVTGYRWMVPETDHPANLFLYSLNSALAGLMGPGGHYSVWGGSWAIRRETFEGIGLREAWHGTLSDDLVASRALHAAGRKVRFTPHAVARSSIDGTWRSTLEFIRRQYLIARRYAPRLWRLGMANHLAAQVGIWGSLFWAAFGTNFAGRAIAGATFVLLYAMAVLRGHWRQRLAAVYTKEDLERLRVARQVDVWLSPVLGLFNLLLLTGSAFGSQIRWRGIQYWISPGGRILTMGRQIEPVAEDDEPVILRFPAERIQRTEQTEHHDQKKRAA